MMGMMGTRLPGISGEGGESPRGLLGRVLGTAPVLDAAPVRDERRETLRTRGKGEQRSQL